VHAARVCRRTTVEQVAHLCEPIAGITQSDATPETCARVTEHLVRAVTPWVHRLHRRHPGNTCLVRAVAVVSATRQLGFATVLTFGAKRDPSRGKGIQGVTAHAWADLGGKALTDPGHDFVALKSAEAMAT
jgi:hypothetical protein